MANPLVTVNFGADTKGLVQGVKEVGKATDEAANATKKLDWKKLANSTAAAAGVAAVGKALKDSTQAATAMTKETLALQRVTGMETETASEWIAVLHSRGIEANVFTRSMTILSKQMEAASNGSKSATRTFAELGVSMEDVRAGDTQAVLMDVADGFAQMENPAKRAAMTQQLFGRASAQLTPILYGGSDAIQEQLDMAKKYGATISDETVGSVKDLSANQREMQMAFEGLKVTLGSALIPLFAAFVDIVAGLVRVMQPLLQHTTALKLLLIALTTALIAYKVATIAATIAQLGLNAAMIVPIAIAVGVIAAISAIIAIGVLMAKHWDAISGAMVAAWEAIKDAAEWTWNWIKGHWPQLLAIMTGPIGIAVGLIVRYWDQIKSATTSAWNAVKSVVQRSVDAILGFVRAMAAGFAAPFQAIWGWLKKLAGWFSAPVDAAKAMASGIKNALSSLVSWMGGIVGKIGGIARNIANAIKAPINAVIGAWNSLAFTVPSITIPGWDAVKVKGKTVLPGFGGKKLGGQTFNFPDIPRLATGGVFDVPTLAVVGEGPGREVVAPESLLRSVVATMTPQVRVYIGDTELKDMVRVEVVAADNGTAQRLLGGTAY